MGDGGSSLHCGGGGGGEASLASRI